MTMKERRTAGAIRRTALRCAISAMTLVMIQVTVPVAQAQTAGAVRFEIAPQSLGAALAAFTQKTGITLAYGGTLPEVGSQGASGTMSSAEALSRILAGSGLTYRFTGANTVTLETAPRAADGSVQLGPVRVEGDQAAQLSFGASTAELPEAYAGGQVARGSRLGTLGNTDVLDSPFSTSSFTGKYIQDNQAVSLADVVANDPSVRSYTSALTSSAGAGDTLFIRGFNVKGQDFLFDGIFGITYTLIPVETMERVEVLKGPTALLYGSAPRGSVGGAINVVPKRAGDTPVTSATLSYLSDGMLGGHVDVGRRFGTNDEWGIRVNALYRDGDGAQDGQSTKLGVATVALDYRGARLRATLDAGYIKQKTTAPSGAAGYGFDTSLPALPAPDLTRQVSQDWEYMETESAYALAKVDYDLSGDWTLYGAAGYAASNQEALSTDIYVTNANGDGTATVYYSPIFEKKGSIQTGIKGEFRTGPIIHKVNINGSYYFERLDQRSNYYGFSSFGTNIYDAPTVARPSIAGFDRHPPKYWNIKLPSLTVSDTLDLLDSRLLLTLGARYQAVKVNVYDPDGSLSQSYDKDAITPALGLVVKPATNLSFFANYIQGLQQGPTAWAGTTNAGQMFPPIKTEQLELGTKYDLGSLLVTASVFQIVQPNSILTTDNTTGLSTFSVDGKQRNRGAELTLSGEPVQGLRLLGGIAYTAGTIRKSGDGSYDGKDAIGVPRWQGNMGVEWDPGFIAGLTLTGRMIVTGPQYADSANLVKLPSWTRFDAGVRYRIENGSSPITIRAAVDNLFAKDYWAGVDSGWVTTGTPRTVRLSATVDF